MRPLLFGLGAIALLILAIALAFPAQFRTLSSAGLAQLVWLLMAALLVGAGAFGLGRMQPRGNLWLAAAFWIAALVGIVLAYRAFS